MRIRVIAVITMLSILSIISAVMAVEENIGIVYQGNLFEVTGVVKNGIALVDLDEFASKFGAKVISPGKNNVTIILENKEVRLPIVPKDQEKQYIPLRRLAVQLDREILWEGNTKTAILAEQSTKILYKKDYALLNSLLADDWMHADSKKELFNYFAPLLAGELLEQVTENSWEFVSQATDWDAKYFLKKVSSVASGKNWRVLLAEITEQSIKTDDRVGHGLFILTKQSDGEWRITAMRYFWPLDKP